MKNLYSLTLAKLEINHYNGFIFEVISIESKKLDGAIFGLHISNRFAYLELLFIKFKIFESRI